MIDTLPGVSLGDYQFALNVALETQVSPLMKEFAHFHDKWRIAQVWEAFVVGVGFHHQHVCDIELQVVAVGTHNCLRKSDRCVASRPMKCRLKHYFFLGIALRFVEPGCRFGLAKNVGYAVVTNPIPGAKISMGVVVEGAPANAPGVLRIGGKLVMDAGVAQRMFGKSLHLVDRLGWICMTDKLGVQIAGMVRRL